MNRSQSHVLRILFLLLPLVILPSIALYEGSENSVAFAATSMILGALLFVWKWRWWWTPVREYVQADVDSARMKDRD